MLKMRVRNILDEISQNRGIDAHVHSDTSFYKIASEGIKKENKENGREGKGSKRSKDTDSLQYGGISSDNRDRSQIVGEGGVFIEPARDCA